MTIAVLKLSAKEFLHRPLSREGERLELVSGEVVVSPRPARAHAYTLLELYGILSEHGKQNQLGILYAEVDTIFDADEVRSPDIQFFGTAHSMANIKDHADILPDLCIEILSPSNARTDRIDKFDLYQSKSIAHYWIVDPEERTIEAYALQNGQYVSSGRGGDNDTVRLPPFPELAIALGQLWHP